MTRSKNKRLQRILFAVAVLVVMGLGAISVAHLPLPADDSTINLPATPGSAAGAALKTLPIKARTAKTGYARTQFGNGWATSGGCDTRNRILQRDLKDIVFVSNNTCEVGSGTLNDPYTGKVIQFVHGANTSSAIQIDHVVALSDAWQKGAQQLSFDTRVQLANDPLELLAVDGPANQQKSDSDAAQWLPPNKAYQCPYVARQISVKKKYSLWVTRSEYDAINTVLNTCPTQTLPN